MMENWLTRVNEIIDEKANGNKSQFVRDTGVSRNSYNGWMRKLEPTTPRIDAIQKICEAYGLSANWLLFNIGDKYLGKSETYYDNHLRQLWDDIFIDNLGEKIRRRYEDLSWIVDTFRYSNKQYKETGGLKDPHLLITEEEELIGKTYIESLKMKMDESLRPRIGYQDLLSELTETIFQSYILEAKPLMHRTLDKKEKGQIKSELRRKAVNDAVLFEAAVLSDENVKQLIDNLDSIIADWISSVQKFYPEYVHWLILQKKWKNGITEKDLEISEIVVDEDLDLSKINTAITTYLDYLNTTVEKYKTSSRKKKERIDFYLNEIAIIVNEQIKERITNYQVRRKVY